MNYAQGWLGAIWKKEKVKGNKISLGSYNDKLAITYICSLGFVLKYRFYYYSNMMKPRDQKTIATEKIVCYSQFLRGGDMPLHAGSHREA